MMTMSFNQLALQDFESARRRALWRDLLSWLTRKGNSLLSFNQVRQDLPVLGQHDLGLQVVLLDKIVGSAGRSYDFDRAFFPRYPHLQDRWMRIDQAHYKQVSLPPVELIKLDDLYFVNDGHHRVSVARVWGQNFIQASVIEVDTSVCLRS
jgi:hypothetical protein